VQEEEGGSKKITLRVKPRGWGEGEHLKRLKKKRDMARCTRHPVGGGEKTVLVWGLKTGVVVEKPKNR